jgi:hypothetical protein
MTCSVLGPPAWNIGTKPLPGLPEPIIRFNIELDWPNSGLARNRMGSAKLG